MIPTAFLPKEEIARLSAAMLIEIGAVHLAEDAPFTLASGALSPVYVDCRRIISFPRVRAALMDFLACSVMRDAGLEAFDTIAGGETAGIPFAALIAERLGLPMCYVRKKPKGYGRNARIEGVMGEGDRVLLVEDLATDGGSKLSFVEAIRATGAQCAHTAVVFSYGIFPASEARLAEEGVRLHSLCTWWDVLSAARAAGRIAPAALDAIETFLRDPAAWRAAQGAAGAPRQEPH
jgi:orotate phosphoribosyltransferase